MGVFSTDLTRFLNNGKSITVCRFHFLHYLHNIRNIDLIYDSFKAGNYVVTLLEERLTI